MSLSGNGKIYEKGDSYIEKVVSLSLNKELKIKNEISLQQIARNISPEIVSVDFDLKKRKCVIMMEKMEMTLSDLLGRIKYDPDAIETVAKNVLDLVDRLHCLSILHNDLHTDNVMIDKNGDLKLIDFGEAVKKEITHEEKRRDCESLMHSDYHLFNEEIGKRLK